MGMASADEDEALRRPMAALLHANVIVFCQNDAPGVAGHLQP